MARSSRLAIRNWLAVSAALTLALLIWQILETRSAARAALTAAEDVKEAERAYVTLEHRQKSDDWPEDFSFQPCQNAGSAASDGTTCYRLYIRVANSGLTPTHIEGGGIQSVPFMDEEPFTPPVRTPDGRGGIAPTVLDPRAFYFERLTYQLTAIELEALNASRLWLVGYVDYVDVFGSGHRAGFCRRVGPGEHSGKYRLWVDSTCGPFNQDRPIGERTGQLTRR